MVVLWRVTACRVLPTLLLLAGCGSEPPDGAFVDGDPALYATEVQPIVERRCSLLHCHGNDRLTLTFYAVGLLRWRDPNGPTELIEDQVTETELEHNRQALASRAGPQDPGGTAVVRRMRPVDAGGLPHADVVVFESRDDPELEVLQRFLGTAHAL